MAEHTTYNWQHYQDFITNVPVRQADLDFFSSIPCARPYLQGGPAENAYKPIPSHSRYRKEDTTDTLFNRTINSTDTIPHMLILTKQTAGVDGTHERTTGPPDLVMLVQLGSELNGFRDTLHGGILAALLDEALGACLEGYRQETDSAEEKAQLFTAELTLSYRAPVTTPGVFVVKSWVKGRQGRKWFLEGEIVGEDGKVRTAAKGLWIGAKQDAQL